MKTMILIYHLTLINFCLTTFAKEVEQKPVNTFVMVHFEVGGG